MSKKLTYLFAVAALLLQGCIMDNECPSVQESAAEVISVRLVDLLSGDDITATGAVDDVVLLFFDANDTYLARLNVQHEQLGTEIELPSELVARAQTRGTGSTLQVSAWGNLEANMFQEEVVAGHTLGSHFLTLKSNTEYIDNWYNPGAMFFGLTTITLGQGKVHTVPLSQKTARLAVTVRGLSKAKADDYYFSMCEQNDGFNFDGTPLRINQWCKIREQGVFNAAGDFTTVEPYYVIPSTDPNDVTACNAGVCLYKVGGGLASMRAHGHSLTREDEPLTSDQAGYVTVDGDMNITGKAKVDVDGNHLALSAGQTTNVLITVLSTGDIAVEVVMTPWDEVHSWRTW